MHVTMLSTEHAWPIFFSRPVVSFRLWLTSVRPSAPSAMQPTCACAQRSPGRGGTLSGSRRVSESPAGHYIVSVGEPDVGRAAAFGATPYRFQCEDTKTRGRCAQHDQLSFQGSGKTFFLLSVGEPPLIFLLPELTSYTLSPHPAGTNSPLFQLEAPEVSTFDELCE